ncbi:MAG: fumarylacetoacetate hydrolase family protein [Acidimicrobiia bacterium]
MRPSWEDPRVEDGQPRQLRLRSDLEASGATPIGWKVGFGAPASLDLMQISAPLMGFLTDATVLQTGAQVEAGHWERGIVEFEVAVYLGQDLGPGATESEARAAIAGVGPAIELANIDLAVDAAHVAEIVAGNIFHKAVILGPPDEGRAGLDITGLVARVNVDGNEVASTDQLEAITGPYPWIVTTVANTLAAYSQLLRRGDVIITGSVIPPLPVGQGSQFEFILEPLEPLAVKLN